MVNPNRNPFGLFCELPERKLSRIKPRYETDDVLIHGVVVRKTVLKMHDYAVPFTPQKGIECFQHDLPTMVKRSIKVERQPCYLSQLGANPIALQNLSDAAERSLRSGIDRYHDEIKNANKKK